MSTLDDVIRASQVLYEVLEEEEQLMTIIVNKFKRFRSPSFFRERWNCEYLRNLAINEGSFVDEYRLDPGGFDHLLQLLMPALATDQAMAELAMSTSGSGPITEGSRLGAALIILGGGRTVEAIRTHGVSSTFARQNLHRVCKAIVNCKELDIQFDVSLPAVESKALRYKHRNGCLAYSSCVGVFSGARCDTILKMH